MPLYNTTLPVRGRYHYREAFWGTYYYAMEHYLDGLALEERAISQNIANANTPGYHPVHIDFGNYFGERLKAFNQFRSWNSTNDPLAIGVQYMYFDFDPSFDAYYDELVANNFPYSESSPLPPFRPKVVHSPKAGVNINQEMAKLAKIQVLYNMYAVEDTPASSRYMIDLFR